MAQEEAEVQQPEEEAGPQGQEQQQDAQAAEQEAPREPQEGENSQAPQPEGTPEEPAEEKKKKKKRRGGILVKFLLLLLLLVLFFEAAMGYLWYRYDDLLAMQEAQTSQTPVQRTVSSSAYANWNGAFRPSDWPEAVAVLGSFPEFQLMWEDQEDQEEQPELLDEPGGGE